MSDIVVRLYDLPDPAPDALAVLGITVRRAMAPEKRRVVAWVATEFHDGWASECEVAFGSHPIGVWIAIMGDEIMGFACADATARGFFGPTGVDAAARGQGIGEALLYATLRGMREVGYAYAIIGNPGPVEFYRKRVFGIEIPDSTPGPYRGMLKQRFRAETDLSRPK